MFRKKGKRNWKCEYDDTIYKIYDWDDNLAGYFYPLYNIRGKNEMDEEEIMVKMNEKKEEIYGGHLMIPFLIKKRSNMQQAARQRMQWQFI